MNFVPGSSRFISPQDAAKLIQPARGRVPFVGVFRNQSAEEIGSIARTLKLDAVQLHGDESPAFCAQIPYPVWKAFGVSLGWDPAIVTRFKGLAVRLFDTASGGVSGGTGKTFDWTLLPLRPPSPWFLAGGLQLENIASALQSCTPDGLDLNSGLEDAPGVKSPEKIEQVMKLLAPWRKPPSLQMGSMGTPMTIDGQVWKVWVLPAQRTQADQEAAAVLEILQVHGGRLVLDARSRAGDPSEIISSLMALQLGARSRGGKLKVRLSPPVLHAMLSASLATVLDLVD